MPKSFRQDHESLMSPHHAAKLTPAEIRSLHNSHALPTSRSPSLSSVHTRSSLRQQRALSRQAEQLASPPLNSSSPRTTAPPPYQRQPSTKSIHIHHNARPAPSQVGPPTTATSYRGIATYRGPEITRTASLTMLQHPAQQIIANPLSAFSRPRQSVTTREHSQSSTPPRTTSWVIENRNPEPSMASRTSSRHRQALPRSESPVSIDHERPVATAATPTASHQGIASDHIPQPPRQPDDKPQLSRRGDSNDSDPSSKQKLGWRRALTGSSEPTDDVVALRKEYRRRTLMLPASQKSCLHAIHYDDTRPGPAPSMKDSLKDDLPSTKTSVFRGAANHKPQPSGDFDQHPAVRPLVDDPEDLADENASNDSRDKGKTRAVGGYTDAEDDEHDIPTYGRCSCCGRVQKPGGPNELDPVIENENLRTNFNLEATRDSMDDRRRSVSIGSIRARYTPIIPMEAGREIRQARIEPPPSRRMSAAQSPPPMPTVTIKNKPGDVIASHSTPLAIMPRMKLDPRLVRFGSLNISREERDRLLGQTATPASEASTAQAAMKRFGSLHGRGDSDPDTISSQSGRQSAYQIQQARSQRQSSRASTQMANYEDDSDDYNNRDAVAVAMPMASLQSEPQINSLEQPRYSQSVRSPPLPVSQNMLNQFSQQRNLDQVDSAFVDGTPSGHKSTHTRLQLITSLPDNTTAAPAMMDYTTIDGHYEPTVDVDHAGNYSSSGPSSPVGDNRGSISSINSADLPRHNYNYSHNQIPMRIQSLMRESYRAGPPQQSSASGNFPELPPHFTFPRKSSLANLKQARKRSMDKDDRGATTMTDEPVPAVPELDPSRYTSFASMTQANNTSSSKTTPSFAQSQSQAQSPPLHHALESNPRTRDQIMVHHGTLQSHSDRHNLSDQTPPATRNTGVAVN